jgi:hypothetical protein
VYFLGIRWINISRTKSNHIIAAENDLARPEFGVVVDNTFPSLNGMVQILTGEQDQRLRPLPEENRRDRASL